jgi:hypothetical protein
MSVKYKLKGICQFCKNKSENILEEYCLKARYRSNGAGYRDIWTGNDCKHDENVKLKDLFESIDLAEVQIIAKKQKERIDLLNDKISLIEEENSLLRNLVGKSAK